MSLCKYKNLFGKLGTGIHSYRIFDIAVLDFVVTAVAAYFIYLFLLAVSFPVPYLVVFMLFFLFGIFIHRLFCVRTTIDKWLFPNVKE